MTAKILIRRLQPIARAGLTAKGVVYVLLGTLAFMAAFGINGKSSRNTDKAGVFEFIQEQPAGTFLLWAVAAGLACYFVWRIIQAFADTEHKGKDVKGASVRGRYLFSGLVYGSLATQVVSMLVLHKKKSGDSSQGLVQELLSKPMGQWLVGIVAIILLATGVYQVWYGLSEKYRKHVNQSGAGKTKAMLLTAGKIGYLARGTVWLLLSYLFFQAAFHANAKEAGGTSKAFGLLSSNDYGPYLLSVVGIGLVCYGAFNFIRARYENFNQPS